MLPLSQEPVYWDREGNLHLNERSHQGFFAGPIKDWMDQHPQYRSLYISSRVLLKLAEYPLRFTSIPMKFFVIVATELIHDIDMSLESLTMRNEEFIELAQHIAHVNTHPPTDLQPSSLNRDRLMVH